MQEGACVYVRNIDELIQVLDTACTNKAIESG